MSENGKEARVEEAFEYERWRHGGWYVTNVHYPSGAVGCVSRQIVNPATGKADGKWRIVCDERDGDHTYRTRDEAAAAERDLVAELWRLARCPECGDSDVEVVDHEVHEVRYQLRIDPPGSADYPSWSHGEKTQEKYVDEEYGGDNRYFRCANCGHESGSHEEFRAAKEVAANAA